ncbi:MULTISPECIES: nuclear transport factor 2 family protein [Haloferax]|uniref:nuclear transport factor 2 family protein n=1 Tax=Haloferax TaxID=2251 RepID=UPI0012AF3ED9|nr:MULTISPECIES: nuclear transport factor 2 family protein [Haloferax]
MVAIGTGTNVEILESAYEAYNRGDIDAVLSVFSEDIEWIEPDGAPSPGSHIGPDAVLNDIFMETMATFEDLSVEPERFIDGGDTVVGVGRFRGKDRESGNRFDVSFAHICDMKDGKITKCVNSTDTAAMLRVFEA